MVLIVVLILSGLTACKHKGSIEPFPTEYIFEILPGEDICTKYKIINYDPLTVGEGIDLPKKNCPVSIVGFDVENTGSVFAWIRNVQNYVKKNCKY